MSGSGTGSSSSSSGAVSVGGCAVGGPDALKLLSQGWVQNVRIEGRTMFENIMKSSGASVGPVFSVEEIGVAAIKVSIKLDVSHLTTVNGEHIDHLVVHGEASCNSVSAEKDAITMAFKQLVSNYRIRFEDYSSAVVKKMESYNFYGSFEGAYSALQAVLVQWDLALGSLENFSVKVQQYEFSDHVRGPITPIGKVYGVLSDYLPSVHNGLHNKSTEIRCGIDEVELDRRHYERRVAKKGRLFLMMGPMNPVCLTSKFILNYVLRYYGLADADYSSSHHPSGRVLSKVVFSFPYMQGFQFGGKIEKEAIGVTYVEAEENATFEALGFIERHFLTKVVDLNFYQRKKEVKIQKTLVSMLSKTLELSDSLKLMFGELINAIEGKIAQFSVDAVKSFNGPMAAGQIDAFSFCLSGLKEVDKYAVSCYVACAPHFEVLHKLSWKLLEFQSIDAMD